MTEGESISVSEELHFALESMEVSSILVVEDGVRER
jgi:hypothetical protein